jgi:Ca2+-binding RTX toxin-like protein
MPADFNGSVESTFTLISIESDVDLLANGDVNTSSEGYYEHSHIVSFNVSAVEDFTPTEGSDHIIGTDRSDIIDTLGGDDFVDLKSGDDILNTGAGNDTVSIGEGDKVIDFGLGEDTLILGDNFDLNLDSLESLDIKNVETINLHDNGTHNVSLSVNDVLEITDEDNIIHIEGDDDDHVDVDTTQWFKESETDDLVTYTDSETDPTVTLEIDSNIDISEI